MKFFRGKWPTLCVTPNRGGGVTHEALPKALHCRSADLKFPESLPFCQVPNDYYVPNMEVICARFCGNINYVGPAGTPGSRVDLV